jgi:acyl-coenzyme A thioesterase PaaI-like protein
MSSSETSPMEQAARAMLERALGDTRQEFGNFFLLRLLGFEISYGEERCIVAFDAVPPLYNPQGSLHGGVLATAMAAADPAARFKCLARGSTRAITFRWAICSSASPGRVRRWR